jgi:tRNA A37 threonylcarbamoyladenosine synthetase subunit TsaC/SUA5/YrdC
MTDPNEIEERFGHALDLVVDGGEGGMGSTTVVDLTGPIPQLVRAGLGPLDGLV